MFLGLKWLGIGIDHCPESLCRRVSKTLMELEQQPVHLPLGML